MENDGKKTDKSGGMYRGVNVPVKLLDAVITLGITAIAAVTLFGIIK